MAPKSSDGEVEEGYLSELEVTELMETPNPDDSGESEQTTDEEGVEEEYSDGEEDESDEEGVEYDDGESYKNEKNMEPEWGYDSFEDRKYVPSSLREYSDEELDEKCRHYKRQLIETKRSGKAGYVGLTTREVCEKLTSLCLQRYNEDEEKNVKLERILRANYNPSSMTKFYITFAARVSESPDAPLVEYQAKAVWSVQHKIYPILCRPSPAPKMVMD